MCARLLLLFSILLCLSCKTEKKLTWQEDESGIQYWLVADSLGTDSLTYGNKVKLQLEILKADSPIYDSRQRGEAIELIYNEQLFGGSLNSALGQMTVGDSSLLKMQADQFYPAGRPNGLGAKDSLNFRIKLLEILP